MKKVARHSYINGPEYVEVCDGCGTQSKELSTAEKKEALNVYEQKMLDWAGLQEWHLIEKISNDGLMREYVININGVKFAITNFYRFEEEFIKLIAKYRI